MPNDTTPSSPLPLHAIKYPTVKDFQFLTEQLKGWDLSSDQYNSLVAHMSLCHVKINALQNALDNIRGMAPNSAVSEFCRKVTSDLN